MVSMARLLVVLLLNAWLSLQCGMSIGCGGVCGGGCGGCGGCGGGDYSCPLDASAEYAHQTLLCTSEDGPSEANNFCFASHLRKGPSSREGFWALHFNG